MCFIDIIRINFTRRYNIHSFPHTDVSCDISVGENVFASICDCGLTHVDEETVMEKYSDSNQESIREQWQ